MAKRVRVSDDNGSNWYTLPGNSGEFNDETNEIDDTIFNQVYQSTQTGLISWTVNSNGLYKGFAGYVATIMKGGTSTTMTGEATTLVSGKTYQITNTAKRLLDRTAAFTVKGNAVAISAANIQSFDYLNGRVTFIPAYTPTTPITIDGKYLVPVTVGCANSFTLTQTAQANDNTCMDTAQGNGGFRTFEYGLKTVALELTGIFKTSNDFKTLLADRTELIIEVNPDGSDKSVARGFFKPVNTGQSGDVGDLETETVTFNLSVPDDSLMEYVFHWVHTATTLNTAIQKCLSAWEAGTVIDVQYLHDGTNGWRGDAVVTEVTLAGGLETMNEFTINFQGSDAYVAVP